MGLFSGLKGIAAVAAPIAGAYFGGPMGAQIGSMIGGKLAGDNIAGAANRGGNQYAGQMNRYGQAGMFKPVGVKTLYGESQFKTDPNTGQLTSASYESSPEVQAQQQQLGSMMDTSLGQAQQATNLQPQFQQAGQGLFDLGSQYTAQSPEALRQRYMQQQMDALRPYDVEQEQRLAAGVFGRGRGGLSVGAGGNPELQALAESRNRRNLQLSAQAEAASQQQLGFGAGLFDKGAGVMGAGYQNQLSALAPYQGQFQTQRDLESAAQQPFTMGLNAGATAMSGQQFNSNMGAKGAMGQLQAGQAGEAARYNIMQGLMGNKKLQDTAETGFGKAGEWLGNMFTPGGGIGGGSSTGGGYGMGQSQPTGGGSWMSSLGGLFGK